MPGVDTYILLCLKVVDWGTADAVEQGTLPENSLLSSGEDEDENPVLAKVNDPLQIFLITDTL